MTIYLCLLFFWLDLSNSSVIFTILFASHLRSLLVFTILGEFHVCWLWFKGFISICSQFFMHWMRWNLVFSGEKEKEYAFILVELLGYVVVLIAEFVDVKSIVIVYFLGNVKRKDLSDSHVIGYNFDASELLHGFYFWYKS